jgi:hypothetical protein
MKKDIQNSILDMSGLVWDSYKLESSVQKFSDAIYNFREKVDELVAVETNIEQQLKELDTCAFNETKFSDILYEIQKSIDYLNLKGFSNLPQWVAKLDEEVERKFAQRLSLSIRVWIDVLLDKRKKQEDDDSVIRRRITSDGTNANHNNYSDSLSMDDSLSGINFLNSNQNNEANKDSNKDLDIETVFKIGGEPKIKPITLEKLEGAFQKVI